MPAGAPVLNKVNWLIGSQQVKAQLVVITLCMWSFLVYVYIRYECTKVGELYTSWTIKICVCKMHSFGLFAFVLMQI